LCKHQPEALALDAKPLSSFILTTALYGVQLHSPLLEYLDGKKAKLTDICNGEDGWPLAPIEFKDGKITLSRMTVLTVHTEEQAAAAAKEEHTELVKFKLRSITPTWIGPIATVPKLDTSTPINPVLRAEVEFG
jgi:hypothetical protein